MTIQNQLNEDFSFLSSKQLKNLNFFLLGFIIYSVSYCYLYSIGSNRIFFIIQFSGLVLLLSASLNLVNLNVENNYLKFIYILYFFWVMIIIYRGFVFERKFLIQIFFNAWNGILLYFVPLVLLFPINIRFYKKLFDVIILLGIICLFFYVAYIKLLLDSDRTNLVSQGFLELFSKTLSIPCAFIILTYRYHNKKRNFIALVVIIVTFLFAVIRARRGLIFMVGVPMIISYMLFLINNRRNTVVILLSIVLVLIAFYFASHVYTENKSGLFSLITDRIDEDTRTGAEEYFYFDMKTQDWVIGKGINGKYYGPGIEDNIYTDYRSVIETDYLQIILKGGIVNLGLLLLIAVPAAIKGIFFSKNMLSKASGLWILLWILNLYPSTVTTFTLSYMVVWIAIGICYNNEIRSMSEKSITHIFNEAYKLPF